jgi:lipopolysaccharide export system permease protein
MILFSYFIYKYLISFIRVLFGFTLLVLSFDFLTNINRLDGLNEQILNALILSFLRTTTYLSQAMPLIIMLSGLAFSVISTRSNEFIITRASGLSAIQSLLPVMLTAFIIGLLSISILDPLAGKLLKSYDAKIEKLRTNDKNSNIVKDDNLWMRQISNDGYQVIKASNESNNGQKFNYLTLFNYNNNGKIIDRYFSKKAFLKEGYFLLQNVTRWSDDKILDNGMIISEKIENLKIRTSITPSQLLEGYLAPDTISPFKMNNQIQQIKSAGFSVLKYQSKKMEQYARPFLFIVMIMIGTVFTFKNSRSRNAGISVILAVALGFFLHFFQSFSITLGRNNEIPLIIATWGPILSVGLIIMTLFLHYEDG